MEYSENDSKPFVEWKLNREMALRSHAEHDASAQALFRSTVDYGLEAIRTAALINGGAVIACFALLGTMRGDAQSALMFKSLLGPAFTFAVGAVLTGCSSGFAYIAQSFHTNAHHAVILNWDAPNFQEDKSEKWRS
jgi:hypothetical protein